MAQEDEKNGDEPIIPEEDFREAIAACCSDPEMNRFFTLAPGGAKLFIGLSFYRKHFGEKVDPRQYDECLSEIEPALGIADLKYLIRFEKNEDTLQYLRGLLAVRKEEAVEVSAEEEKVVEVENLVEPEKVVVTFETSMEVKKPVEPSKVVEKPVEAEKPAEPPKAVEKTVKPIAVKKPVEAKKTVKGKAKVEKAASGRRGVVPKRILGGGAIVVEDEEVGGPMFPPIAVAAVAALFLVVVGGLWWIYSTRRAEPSDEVKIAENVDVERPERAGPANLTNRMAEKRARKKPETVNVMEHMSVDDPDETDAQQHAATPAIAEQAAVPETPHVAAAALPSAKGKSRRRVVFTDGRKIVRHSNGLVEVPRVFSCAGAGVKPFWIYSANPEADAAKERKAREEWESLCREVE